MCSRRKVNFLGVWVLLTLTITCIQAFPGDRQARQEDEDESERSTISPINFGAQVAQIITGAFTGNIDSIIKGSFGFIEDPNVNKLSHNTWETLKGNPTQKPPWASTAAPARPAQAAAAAPPPQPEQQPQPAAAQVSSLSAAAPQLYPEVAESAQASSSGLSALPVAPPEYSYNPGTSSYRTRRPARTTQPTYATLAPLSAVEGDGQTESEPEESSTTVASTDPDDEDVDEAESLSGEVSGGGTSAPTEGIPVTEAITVANREVTTVVIEGAEATTEEDDEQDQENFIYST